MQSHLCLVCRVIGKVNFAGQLSGFAVSQAPSTSLKDQRQSRQHTFASSALALRLLRSLCSRICSFDLHLCDYSPVERLERIVVGEITERDTAIFFYMGSC